MNIIVVSYFYPPVTKPRAIQVARLMSASSARKLVFCGEGGQTSPLVDDGEDHVRIPVAWKMPRWRKSLHSAARLIGGGLAGSWEPYNPWKQRVLKTVPATIRRHAFNPDAIATFGHPWVDHEVGLALKQMLGIPWLAHFSDPWVDNPLVGMQSPAARAAVRDRESAVIHAADRTIFTSQETIDLVLANYPDRLRARASVLPHCFDPDLFPEDAGIDSGAIRCLGKWYGDRRPDVLFEALELIESQDPDKLAGRHFEIIGNYDPGTTGEEIPAKQFLRFRSPVPYLESLRLMASAQALFLVDAPSEKSVFLPSKLIEYIGAARPVFGITPPGTADRLIRRYGGLTADPTDVGGVATMIDRFLSLLPKWTVDHTVRDEFSMANVGKRFDDLVIETVGAVRKAVIGTAPEGRQR